MIAGSEECLLTQVDDLGADALAAIVRNIEASATRPHDARAVQELLAAMRHSRPRAAAATPLPQARPRAPRRRRARARRPARASDGDEGPARVRPRDVVFNLGGPDPERCRALARLLAEQALASVFSSVAINSDATEAATSMASEERVV